MAMATVEASPTRSLKLIFEEALLNYDDILTYKVPQQERQILIQRTIKLLEEATNLINLGEIFSSNEMLEEVSTECIQYLAIPAMLGCLVGNVSTGDRLSNLEVSEIYYTDFMRRCKEYGLVKEETSRVLLPANQQDLTRSVLGRNEKARKFEEQKKLRSDLVTLKENLERADDEVRRKYFTLFVKGFVNTVEEDLVSIAMEKPMAAMRKENPESGKRLKRPAPPPLKPVIIARNELQKKVYGMGYPSLPTMTVDEFYEERVREGIFPAAGSNHNKAMQDMVDPEVVERLDEEESAAKDEQEDRDDPEELLRQRNMDEYKDEHRRGWGNRHNRS